MKRRRRDSIGAQLDELRERIDEIGQCPTQVLLLEEAISLADSANDLESGFELRKELVEAATFTGSPEKALVAFTWNLAQADRDPSRFDETDLLWQYKWVINSLHEFPQITLQQMEKAIDDLERRFRRNGASLRPVYTLKCNMHRHTGNVAQVRALLPAWKKSRRGYLADCVACDRDSLAEMHYFLRQDRRALKYAEPLLAFKMQCTRVPHVTFADALLPLVRLSRVDEAYRHHRQGYPMVKKSPDLIGSVAEHLVFLVLVSNLKEAIKVFEQHLRLALEISSPADRLEFLRASLFLFLQLMKGPHERRLRLPESFPLWKENGNYDAAEIANWLEGRARAIAKEFDTRNGNTCHTDEIEELDELAKLIRKE